MTEFGFIIVIVFILFCLFVVLVERKVLAHAQRRFGPSIAGRNGWFQIVLDLFKLATKELFIVPSSNNLIIPLVISFFFFFQLVFIQNFIFGPSLLFFYNIDGIFFYHLIFVMFNNILLLVIGILSQSKYSLIGIFRAVIHVISVDIFITIVYILIILNVNSGNFHDLVIFQFTFFFILIFLPISFIFIIILLIESKRAPFDHIETESEVVAGYATEYSGLYLLIFYLIEYFHLIVSANHFTIFFLGGWFFFHIFSFLLMFIYVYVNPFFF